MASHHRYSTDADPPHSRDRRSIDTSSAANRARRSGRSMDSEAVTLPERFRNSPDEDDDANDSDDGTGVGNEDPTTMFAQQSMYGMLAATQSRATFPSQFQQDSGSESEDERNRRDRKGSARASNKDSSHGSSKKQGQDARRLPSSPSPSQPQNPRLETPQHRNKLSQSKLVRSWLRPIKERGDAPNRDPMTQSQFLPTQGGSSAPPRPRRRSSPSNIRSDAPMLDQKLRAMAKAGMRPPSSGTTSNVPTKYSADVNDLQTASRASKPLPEVIANIFQFPEPEEVIAEFPCWYLQNVLLEGYMYVTNKHVCFYAYLQKKANIVLKSGHLSKLPKHGLRYRRYWFVLKGDTFSYHEKASEPYFPLNQVDLRYAISADLTPPTEQEKEMTEFTVTTPGRTYFYRAETPDSAKEWVKQLQRVIFRSHNDGDSVKISLPIDNILDIERNTVIESAETIKFRVIDNEETFAVDEYFFSFFDSGQDAVHVLGGLVEHGDAREDIHARKASMEARNTQSESVCLSSSQFTTATSPPTEDDANSLSRARARTRSRRNTSKDSQRQRQPSQSPSSIQESAESLTTASELAPSSISTGEDIDADMSASQMLVDEGVFRGPTLRSPPQSMPRFSAIPAIDRLRQDTRHASRSSSSDNASGVSSRPSLDATSSGGRPELERQQSAGSGRTVEQDDYKPHGADAATSARNLLTITAPIQHAINLASAVRSQGKRMSSYLSSSPKNYIDRWSDAIAGGKRQYIEVEGLAPDDSVRDPEQDLDVAEHQRRFREHFGLLPSEQLVSTFFCWIHKTVPLYGKVYIGTRSFCFRSLWYGTKTKIVIPFKDIDTVHKQRGFRWGYPGMVLVIKGHEELFFDFPSTGLRDDCVVTVLQSIETKQAAVTESVILTKEEQRDADDAANENELLQAARKDGNTAQDVQTPRALDKIGPPATSVVFDDPGASVLDFTPKEPMRIVCLTIGSRGDVQPYIALCKGLLARGHKPKIATHKEFGPWVKQHGIEFAEVAGDPAELIRICVDNGMFTPSFFMEANSKFRSWLDGLLDTAYEACKGADLIIESPSAMCGIHIAEALEIPYFRAFTMPWTRTRAYPHAFAVPNRKLGGGYNYMTYTFFDNMFWQAIAGQINRWRGKSLGLGPTSLDKLQQNKVPFLYNFSPSVVVPPLDFSDWIKVTGYWFLDEGKHFTPPSDLAAFIRKAREDKQKLVYIGFGSITVADSRQLTQQVIDAVLKADVRCILSKGWSDRLQQQPSGQSAGAALPDLPLPACIHPIRSAPHDWLFAQMDAVVHHGGAGTTGASLRAGVPTIIKPFFGDQHFFATRVADLGVGIHLPKVTASHLGRALWLATHDARMRAKAAALGRLVRAEDGVGTAISALWRDLDYARSLIKHRGAVIRRQQLEGAADDDDAGDPEADGEQRAEVVLMEVEDQEDDTEEKWTFIEKDASATAKAKAAQRPSEEEEEEDDEEDEAENARRSLEQAGVSDQPEVKRSFMPSMVFRGRLL